MKRILLDTETTGLDSGNVVQLSYIVLNENNEFERAENYFFTVDYVPQEVIDVHGFTQEKLKKLSGGKRFSDYVLKIKADLDWNWFIAHNAEFDYKFLAWEFAACGSYFIPARTFCTMRYMTNIMKLPPKPGHVGYKYPRTSEMAEFFGVGLWDAKEVAVRFFGEENVSNHDARFDVSMLYLCYLKMLEARRSNDGRA